MLETLIVLLKVLFECLVDKSADNKSMKIYPLSQHAKSFLYTSRSGDVEIKLRNRGVDAFKHDEYGDSIIVQRKFSNDGGSSYKLKAKNGKIHIWPVKQILRVKLPLFSYPSV